MNLFRRWFQHRSAERLDSHAEPSDAVLHLLGEAADRDDGQQFLALCQQHAQTILARFAFWRTVPQPMRGDRKAVERRAEILMLVAQLFEQGGHPELMATLVGTAEHNPLLAWEEVGRELQRLSKMRDPEQGLAAALRLLASIEDARVTGPGFLSNRAKARGVQAMMLVKLGRHEEARTAVEAALTDCEEAGDVEGIQVYRKNLAVLDSEQPTVPGRLALDIEILEQVRLAQRRTDLRRYRASNDLLEKLLATSGEAAPIVEQLRPHLLARIGFNEFKLGHLDTARERISAARDGCRADHDDEGAEVYEENLAAIERSRTAS